MVNIRNPCMSDSFNDSDGLGLVPPSGVDQFAKCRPGLHERTTDVRVDVDGPAAKADRKDFRFSQPAWVCSVPSDKPPARASGSVVARLTS
jgi:hypothetical protein